MAHPFYLLNSGDFLIQTKTGLFMEEHEYEKAKVVQDLFEYEHNFYKLASIIGFPHEMQIGLEFSFHDRGELSKEYSPSLNIPSQNFSYKGFHALEAFLQKHFQTDNEKNKLAFEVRLKGSPLKGKETNNTYPGKDIAISLLYSHLHNSDWRIYGDLHAEIIGKKIMRKFDGELETFDAYSQFGNLIGIQWLKGRYWFDINTLFYLTTDYNSKSASYTRLTDKGFMIGGKILAGFYITPKTTLTIEHVRQGSNFNVITESTTQATEFEIETQYSQIGLSWLF